MLDTMLTPPPEPTFTYDAALYFLPAGHYLFKTAGVSKFVTANDVAAAFSQVDADTGWMPPGVVRCGSNAGGPWFVYSAPAQRVAITLELSGRSPLSLKVPIPRTVLLCANGQTHIFATRTDHFDPQAAAYHAPFPNVYLPNGRVCWGQNPQPEINPAKARATWQAFFATPFNGHLANQKSHSHAANVCDLLQSLDGRRTFPGADMFPVGKSVQSVITWILEETRK